MGQAIVGLGNPGPEYRDTRHNVGARVLDAIAAMLHVRFGREGGHLVAAARWHGEPVHLIKPQSYMNETGPAVAKSLYEFFLSRKILVRAFPSHPLTASFLRISVGTDEEMLAVNEAIDSWLRT